MAETLEKTHDTEQAKSWLVDRVYVCVRVRIKFLMEFFLRYLQALSLHRTDGHLHRRIGELIDNQGDKVDAIQYYFDVKLEQEKKQKKKSIYFN